MDEKNSLDDMNSSCITWINSELYNLKKDYSDNQSDRNLLFSGDKYAYDNFDKDKLRKNEDNPPDCAKEMTYPIYSHNTRVKENKLLTQDMASTSQDHMEPLSVAVEEIRRSSLPLQNLASSASALPQTCFMVNLYIETKMSHVGPLPFDVHPKMSVRLLKLQVENELGIPASFQKWIFNNSLGTDNDKSLKDYAVTPTSAMFLYVDSSFDGNLDLRQLSGTIQNRHSTSGNKFKPAKFNSSLYSKSPVNTSMHKRTDNTNLGEILDRKSSFDDSLKTQMLFKYLSESNNSDSAQNEKLYKYDTKCGISKEDFKDNASQDHYKVKKGRKGSLKAISSNTRKDKSLLLTRHLSIDYIGERPQCITDAENNIVSNMSLTVTDDLNYGSDKFIGTEIPPFEDEKDSRSVLQSGMTNENSPNGESEVLYNDEVRPKPKKSFLQKLKLKNEAKPVKGISHNLNVNSGMVDEGVNENKSLVPELLDIVEFQIDSCHNDLSRKACGLSDFYEKLRENKVNVNDNIEEIKSAQIVKTICIENDDILTFEGISKSSQIIESFLPGHPLFAEISIQNDVDNVSVKSCTDSYEITECNIQSPDNGNSLKEEHFIEESDKNYQFLLRMENLNLVRNVINFTCPVCFGEFESDQGVVLHECLHTFCFDCLRRQVEYAEEAQIKCPYRDELYSCQSHLQQREIKALVPEDVYEKYLQRSIITAESLAEKSFHCKTPDCPGWCMFEDNFNVFHCPVCSHYNCLNCMALHEGLNCRQYQDKLIQQKKMDPDSEKTLQLLNKMIENGKAVKCPKCDLILMKKWGCDWLKCSVCLTEICWITRGPRWGPGGQGDTSAGCRCGVNGIKCHPSCTYCH